MPISKCYIYMIYSHNFFFFRRFMILTDNMIFLTQLLLRSISAEVNWDCPFLSALRFALILKVMLFIVERLPHDVVLGLDTLQSLGFCIDFEHNQLRIGKYGRAKLLIDTRPRASDRRSKRSSQLSSNNKTVMSCLKLLRIIF